MKVLKTLCIAALALLIAAPAVSEVPKKYLQKLYVDFLTAEGYKPQVDDDGDVTFKYEGGNYYIEVNEDDPTYFRLVYPNFWEIESDEEQLHVALAASYANEMTKVAKVNLTSYGDTEISIELFMVKSSDFKDNFKRMLDAIDMALEYFQERMDELDGTTFLKTGTSGVRL